MKLRVVEEGLEIMDVAIDKEQCQPGEYYVENECNVRGQHMQDLADECTVVQEAPKPWADVALSSFTCLLILGIGGTGKT